MCCIIHIYSSQQLKSSHYFQEHREYLPKLSTFGAIKQVLTNLKGLKSHRIHSLTTMQLSIC